MASLPLGLDPGGEPVILYLLHPSAKRSAPSTQSCTSAFCCTGASRCSWPVSARPSCRRSLLAPLRSFVGFMESVAETGEYSRRFDSSRATAELRTLNASYDRLIESLARQHAELSQRTEELSRTNVTLMEQMLERERAEQALRASEQQLRQSQNSRRWARSRAASRTTSTTCSP